MSGWSSPSLSPAVVAVVAAVWLLVLAYAVLFLQQVLVGLLPGIFVLAGYVAWRLLVAIEAVADGIHRLADVRERAADGSPEEPLRER